MVDHPDKVCNVVSGRLVMRLLVGTADGSVNDRKCTSDELFGSEMVLDAGFSA